MCLALVAWRAHDRYALVVAANRDEFHARATAPADWWDEGWLAGRDLAGGGTWLGVTRGGRWALLTNVREPARHDPRAPTRGTLVPGVLAAADGTADAVAAAVAATGAYNGFNLLAGDCESLHWGSNRAAGQRGLAAGVHGLSNAALDTPWPKVVRTKAALGRWCEAATVDLEPVFDLLADRATAPDDALPATGVPLARERQLSAPFIVGTDYGTRSSTVLAITPRGDARFVERSFDAAGRVIGERDHRFAIALPAPR
jgi:uncharacterized protein with NRDE domain